MVVYLKIKKDKHNFSEWYNIIIKEAELCDLRYGIKGFVVFRPWSVSSMKKMYAIYEKTLEEYNHQPALFPALIPEHFFKKEAEHIKGFTPEVLWVTEAGGNKLEERYAMRPTSETAMYSMYSLWIQSKNDLPLKIYHSCQVWRYETKATKPFIRSREFYWIETHNAFATKEEALNQVKEDMQITKEIMHDTFGIPFIFFRRPQWDKFAGAVDTYAADTLLPDGKALQLPSTHMLGQNFAKPFDVKYMDDDGNEKYVWQTCYGPAISRIYAAVISIHGDESGLIIPPKLAPVDIVIIPIIKSDKTNEKILNYANEIKQILNDLGYKVILDKSDKTPGWKFNQWEMKGVPLRISIGLREVEQNNVEIKIRGINTKEIIPKNELKEKISEYQETLSKWLVERADKFFNGLIYEATSIEQLNNILEEKGGFVRVPFCTDQMEGKECADIIKEKTHGNIRGTRFDKNEKPKQGEKCIVCGKQANVYVYVARQY